MLNPQYLAGFIDGEGYIGVSGHRRGEKIFYIPQIKICNNNRTVLDEVKAEFGGSISLNSNRPRHIMSQRPNYQYMATTKRCLKLLKFVEPYLKNKREQARLAIEFAERMSHTGKSLSIDEIKWRQYIRYSIQNLNRKYNGHSDSSKD